MIKPTNGRVVWFHKGPQDPITRHDPAQPLAAIIVHVHSDTLVNLVVFDSDGMPQARTSIELWQDGALLQDSPRSYCEWMPYQKGQAAKTEQLEQRLGTDAGRPVPHHGSGP